MHKYTQDLFEKYMGKSKRPKSWTEYRVKRFARFCYEKAPTCGCGCGQKTMPINFNPNNPESESVKFKPYISFHDRLKAPFNYKLTRVQKQAVLASIVGDGYLSKPNKDSNYARLVWNMGDKNHAMYKHDFFKDIGVKYTEKENSGWGSIHHTVVTSCHPCFSEIYEKFYKDGKKIPELIPSIFESLDAVGWAWFYGDDGHLSGNDNCYLHTEGYGKQISQSCADAVNKFTGINGAKVFSYVGGTPKKQRFCVSINTECSDEFISRIKKYMAHGMEYKIGKNNINRRNKRK